MAFFHFLKKILCCDSDIFSTTSCIDFEDDNEGNVWRQKHSVQVKIQKMYNLGKLKQLFDILKFDGKKLNSFGLTYCEPALKNRKKIFNVQSSLLSKLFSL